MQGLREPSHDYEILQIHSVILHHLDVIPCHAVIIRHTPTPRHSTVMCIVQSNIYSAQNYNKYLPFLVKIWTHSEWKQSSHGNNSDWVHLQASEDDRITTCFVASVPLGWFPEDDPSLVTLQHCQRDSRHVPPTQTAIVSLMSFCLWFQTLDTFLSAWQAASGIIARYAATLQWVLIPPVFM